MNKKPVLIGMDVFESMESDVVAKTGKLPLQAINEQLLGGHAVLIVGYVNTTVTATNSSTGYFIVRNSWGQVSVTKVTSICLMNILLNILLTIGFLVNRK